MELNKDKKAAIWLSDEDSLKFKLFLENYETFSTLLESKVFEQKSAAITLHFDVIGTLRSITRTDILHTRKKEKISPLAEQIV